VQGAHVGLPCTVSQSALFPPLHSSRRDAIIKRRRRPLRLVAGVTAPLGQSTEIQSRRSLALSGIVKTDNRIYTGFLNLISGFGGKSDINITSHKQIGILFQ